jgi:myo-inositol-1-phosphate synthase
MFLLKMMKAPGLYCDKKFMYSVSTYEFGNPTINNCPAFSSTVIEAILLFKKSSNVAARAGEKAGKTAINPLILKFFKTSLI